MLWQVWAKIEDAQVVVKWFAGAFKATQAVPFSFRACVLVRDVVVHGGCSQIVTHPNCWIEELAVRGSYACFSSAIEISSADRKRIAYVRVVDHLYLHLIAVVNDFFYASRMRIYSYDKTKFLNFKKDLPQSYVFTGRYSDRRSNSMKLVAKIFTAG